MSLERSDSVDAVVVREGWVVLSIHHFEPWDRPEEQLEQLLDELNRTLRPRIEKPVRQRPLLAVGVALGVGVLLGAMLNGGRRS